jgi:ATP/maltotriose-dependent transcriptional regulator MalT
MEYLNESLGTARDIGARYVEANALVALAGALLARNHIGDVHQAESIAREAVKIAQSATLVGPEIQALSRQAEAIWRLGDVDGALELSQRAIDLMDRQRYVEGSEVEILYTHYRLLRARGDEHAHGVLERATGELERKLGDIETPTWRRAFRENVAVNAAILAESVFAKSPA